MLSAADKLEAADALAKYWKTVKAACFWVDLAELFNVKDKPSLNKHLGEARSPCRSAADKLESAGADAECRVPVSALAVRAAWLQFLQLYRHYLPNHGRTVGTYRAGEIESSRGNLFICAELGLVIFWH